MALNGNYIVAPSLEMYFVDKTTGLPLSGGTVYFYEDSGSPTTLKNVYTISGTPPNYNYVALPNPMTLSAVGTTQDDSGNNVLPYFYPYDSDGNIQLYTIKVFDSNGTLQFTRNGWPNLASQSTDTSDFINYIENPQFLTYYDVYEANTIDPTQGLITGDTTSLAPGGWYYTRTAGSNETMTITFPAYGSPTTNPPASPRVACQLACTGAGTGYTTKWLEKRYADCNKFQNPNGSDTQTYTLAFWGTSVGSETTISIVLYKYFGTGGSAATTTTLMSSTTLPVGETKFTTEIDFGDNTGKTITSDSYVSIAIAFVTNGSFTANFTDFILTPTLDQGQLIDSFPSQPDSDWLSKSLMGYIENPASDGSDLYLPIQLTRSGVSVDTGQIGMIYALSSPTVPDGYMICDGSDYATSEYSSIGIPYARLQAKYWDSTAKCPVHGTGSDYMTAIINPTSSSRVIIMNNAVGPFTAWSYSAGAGFTTSEISPGVASPGALSQLYSTTQVMTNGYYRGAGTGYLAKTVSWTVINYSQSDNVNNDVRISMLTDCDAVTTLSAGEYISFESSDSAGSADAKFIWFKIDGAGSEPSPAAGGQAYPCNVTTGEDAETVAIKVFAAINGYQSYDFTCPPASGITAGAYLTMYTSSYTYVFWFYINGSGTAPTIPGANVVKITLTGSETAPEVGSALVESVNSQRFAVPDASAAFLRGWADSSSKLYSRFAYERLPVGPYYSDMSNNVGSVQMDNFLAHYHGTVASVSNYEQYAGSGALTALDNFALDHSLAEDASGSTTAEGHSETRAYNLSVKWIVKY